LPDDVAFLDASKKYKNIDDMNNLESNCKLVLPKEINSICVIDGQHRIFAHYESGIDNKQEQKISELRKQLHLLVTGLIFPSDMKQEERARIQSEIFLDINSNAKPVPPNVLLQIKRIKNPVADESIAQFIIEKLNKEGIFQNLLQISSLESGKIKTASIVRFALRYLVTITPSENKQSLFNYWEGDKEALLSLDEKAIQEYVKFCATVLRSYFGALRKNFKSFWDNENSKLLSVISINGFIIALTRQLSVNGIHDFDYYDKKFNNLNIDFSKEQFPYTSSQYRKFSSQILTEAFGLDPSLY
jgi:DGQHR domain-containing protein